VNVPANQPLSADIIDRRDGQTPTLAERVRDLMIKVHRDYQDSFNKTVPSSEAAIGDGITAPIHPNDGPALQGQINQVLGGSTAPLSSGAAQRIRSQVNSGQ
jgi:hypothetical protein